MDLDIDDTRAAEPAASDAVGMDLRSLAVDTLRRPSAAMQRLAAKPDRRWLWPLVLLTALSVAATASSLPAKRQFDQVVSRVQLERMQELNPQMMRDLSVDDMTAMTSEGPAAMIGSGMALVGALVSPILAALIGAAVLHFLGTLLGGQQTYTQMLTATVWARLPLALQSALRVVDGVLGNYDPNPNGLAGLVAVDPLTAFARPSPLGPVLAQISIWNIWMLILFMIAVRVVCRVSIRKALAAVAVYVALLVLLGEASVGFGRVMAGFGESMIGG